MKIETKLIITLVVVASLIALAGYIMIYQLNSIAGPLNTDLPRSINALNDASFLDSRALLIRYYDEVLTQSVRNYAFTQDAQWEARYRETEPLLDRAIKEAIDKGDEIDKEFFMKIDQANVVLVFIEYRAIELVNSNRSGEAISILEGEEYRDQKRIYNQGLSDFATKRGTDYDQALQVSSTTLQMTTTDVQKLVSDNTQIVIVAIPVILASTIVVGFMIFRSITKPITYLRNAANDIANKNFDVEIKASGSDEISDLAQVFNKMKNEIKIKDRLKDEFISIASHELKTPIQPILGSAVLAKRGDIGQEEAWNVVISQARRLQQLANDILDVSRIESGNLTYRMEKIKINEILDEVIATTRMGMPPSITIESFTSGKDTEIDGDRTRLHQVIANIVGNAVKFTAKGKIEITLTSSIERNFAEIRVSDSGAGIPVEIIPNLFGKFVTKNVHGNNKHGTGLGLFISKAIVEAHNGEISVQNNERGGATFTVLLPVDRNEKILNS